MNNKGFTLVELLAMLLVLGILMAIAVPNITGILANNKMNIMKADATKMVDTAKIKFSSVSKAEKPTVGKCVVYALNALNDSGDISSGPNGGSYEQFNSFVVITRRSHKYEYYVRLIEVKDSSIIGMDRIEREKLIEDNTDYIKSMKESDLLELTGSVEADKIILEESGMLNTMCPNGITSYTPGRILS